MRIVHVLSLCAAVLLFSVAVAAEGDAADFPGWSELAGMEEELAAEKLELRDELIAANLSFLSSFDLALAEVLEMDSDDPRRAPAWARVEYLLETSYRLLDDTGEFESFLKSTENLRPAPFSPPPVADFRSVGEPGGSGLAFSDQRGNAVRLSENGFVYAEDGRAVPDDAMITATASGKETAAPDAYVELLKSRAAWLRARVFERLGKIKEAGEETAGLGIIRDWLVVGPLESESEAGSYVSYSLEEIYNSLGASPMLSGKIGPVSWRPFESEDPLGRLFFEALFRTAGRKTAFALALVHADSAGEAVMRFGSNAPIVVCVNHIQERRSFASGVPDPGQTALPVWLRKGWNVVFVRSSAADGPWSMAARLTRPDGSPFPGYVAVPSAVGVGEFLAKAQESAAQTRPEQHYRSVRPADLGGVSVLSERLVADPGDARANFYLASLLVAKRMMEGEERFDREMIFRRASEYSGGDAFFTLMAARSVDSGIEGPDREENLRLVLLKMVVDQGSAAALVDMGRLYLDVMRQPRRADAYAELATSVNPLSLRAGVLDYDVAVDMGWEPVAKTLLAKLVNRHPGAAAARLRLGRAALAGGRPRQALTEFHAILGADARNSEALDGAVSALGMLGQTSAALELLSTHIARFPYDYRVRLKLAELYRVLGRDDEARAVLDAALTLAPDDPEAATMRADSDRETYAEGKAAESANLRRVWQEVDVTPPAEVPPGGWEYLFFQVEDRMRQNGTIDRVVSFTLKIHSLRAARMLRHLNIWSVPDFRIQRLTMLNLVHPNGEREILTPPNVHGAGLAPKIHLPPLRSEMMVEAEFEMVRDGVPFLGEYFGQIAPMTQIAPIRMSRYMFTAPKDARIYFRPVNGAPEAMVVTAPDGREVTRIWEMTDLPAFSSEPYSPGSHELMPCVQVSSFKDWDEFARWYWRLIGAQYHSPPELAKLAADLAGDEPLPLARLDLAAEWVAKNIGHREWEYGPYAFRPITARAILSRMSADGKDRTLLLCLLAREYGLKAWPVLARFRDRRFALIGSDDLSLPLLEHFNHSLVMVESQLGGDIFLDASNPYRNPGVMPSQLFGSPGMAMMQDSANPVMIPDNGVSACEWDESAELVVDDDGSVLWEEEIRGVGTAAEALRRRFNGPDARTDAWAVFLSTQGATPTAAWDDFQEDPSAPAAASFSGRARLRRYAFVDDGRVVASVPALPGMSLPGGGRDSYPLSLDDIAAYGFREQDLVLPHGFKISRTIAVSYPSEWKLANPVESFTKDYSFGQVKMAFADSPGSLEIQFVIDVPGHRIKTADYPAFREAAALAARWLCPLLVWEKP